MSTIQKRGRACEACSKIKIKCELGSVADAAPPCERCVRLGKDCTLVAPKRQKDRVAELEAEVERLTRLLREKGIANMGDDDMPESVGGEAAQTLPPVLPASSSSKKKRKMDSAVIDAQPNLLVLPGSTFSQAPWPAKYVSPDSPNPAICALDRIISRSLQERLVDKYVNEMLPTFPLVRPPENCTLDSLRQQSPILLQAMMYAASPGVLQANVQEDMMMILLNGLANEAITDGNKTLELIQALQITCLWFRSPAHHRHVAVYQLVQLAAGIAVDIGLGGPGSSPSLMFRQDEGENLETADAWRAWLTTYLLSGGMSIFSRRPNPVPWTQSHDQSCMMLEYSDSGLPTDKWLTQYIRAEHMCEQIADQLGFYDNSSFTDISDPSIRRKMQSCRNQILNWRAQLPTALQVPTLLFWEHVATAYLHEAILHTPTNKLSFAAPYVSDRISVSDFPAPIVTPDHTASLYELNTAAHKMIDIFVAWDPATLTILPALVFVSRAAYAIYMLLKIYVAVTAPGNTYGAVFRADMIQLEQRTDQMLEVAAKLNAIDSRSGAARIMRAVQRAKDWYTNYITALNSSVSPDTDTIDSMYPFAAPEDNTAFMNNDNIDLKELFLYSDVAADFGLESLFAEAPAADADFLSQDVTKAPYSAMWFPYPSSAFPSIL